jgi:hypothetical protein
MRVFCYRDDYSENRVPTIDPELERIITVSGGIVEVDVYPQKHWFRHADCRLEEVWV